MKGGITTMTLDFSSKQKFIDDVYRYFNDSRICTLAGDCSDVSYDIIHKTMKSSGLKGYAQLINLAVNKCIYVYNKLEAKFYRISLDDTDISKICTHFFIKNLEYLDDCNSGIKVSRTDGRVLDNDHPMAIYIGISDPSSHDEPTSIKPFYFDISSGSFETVIENLYQLLNSYILEEEADRYRTVFNTTIEELKAQNRKICDDLISSYAHYNKSYSTVVSGIECISSRDYYDRCNGNPKFHPIISEPTVTPTNDDEPDEFYD